MESIKTFSYPEALYQEREAVLHLCRAILWFEVAMPIEMVLSALSPVEIYYPC
jgi:hypothetical protein